MKPLADKIVLVTGAASGIGRAIALTCAGQGAALCLADIDAVALERTRAEVDALGGAPALACETDIGDSAQIDRLFDAVHARHARLDAVVANAGIVAQSGAAHETSLADWERFLRINLTGTFLTVAAGARYLIAQGKGGCILATGSSTALRVMPGGAAYIASKGGVHALMQAMAVELGPHRIRVNTLVPGQTNTPPLQAIAGFRERAAAMLPLGEIAEPVELARLAAFAISDAAPHMTGSHLKIDSGRTIA
ncbi:MAG: SDR family NAD(P)-dependent oxidoreductase [Sphingomonas sp.]